MMFRDLIDSITEFGLDLLERLSQLVNRPDGSEPAHDPLASA